jgi:hypothetical protein
MIISRDTSPTNNACSCYMIHHLLSTIDCHITNHRYMVISCNISPNIDVWSCHVICHLTSMHGHVILLYVTVMLFYTSHTIDVHCMAILYDSSPTIDKLLYHVIRHTVISCDTVGHLFYNMIIFTYL